MPTTAAEIAAEHVLEAITEIRVRLGREPVGIALDEHTDTEMRKFASDDPDEPIEGDYTLWGKPVTAHAGPTAVMVAVADLLS